jgi:hypothetical protein
MSSRLASLIVFVALVTALTAADRAGAEPPPCGTPTNPDCTPKITYRTITHTLTVTRPSAGTITSTPAGISCPAGSGGDCTQPDSQQVQCIDNDCADPDDSNWTTYTLTASGGPTGFATWWGGSCSGSTCSVTLSDDRSVSLTWVDVTNPSVFVAPGSVKVGKTLNASAAASDNAGVAKVEFWLDGSLKAVDTTAPYTASIPMDGYAQGSAHTLLARAYDTSGRAAESSSTVTVDKVVTLTLGTVPAYTNAATVPLTVGTDADATLKCALNGGTASACAGTFSPVGAASPDGSYTYSVTATDDVNNVATASRTFVLDRTAPTIADFDGPSEGGQVATDAVTITYHAADANLDTVTCTLDGAALPCGPGSASLTDLANSAHAFTVTATDKAGNTGSKVRTFSVQKPAAGGGTTAGGGATPLPGSPPLAANPAVVRYAFTRRGGTTTFTRLSVAKVPVGAKVTATCKGRGCPKRTVTLGKSTSITAFVKRKLRAGAVIRITIAKPGTATKTIKLTVRAGKDPKLG